MVIPAMTFSVAIICVASWKTYIVGGGLIAGGIWIGALLSICKRRQWLRFHQSSSGGDFTVLGLLENGDDDKSESDSERTSQENDKE